MNTNFGIYSNSFALILNEFQKYQEIEKASIFGSRAMGNYKKGSDIDIAIFGQLISRTTILKLIFQLNEELPIPYFIDIVHFESTENEELKNHIIEQGKIIYTK
jgi:predicted nucleotidyltransferase